MTNKEYREKLNNIYTFDYYDMMGFSVKERREDQKRDIRREHAFTLDGFNVRAVVIPVNGGYVLKSYDTIVCGVVDGEFFKAWDGYSATTMKHINVFREWCGFKGLNKREWVEIPATVTYSHGDYVDMNTGAVIYPVYTF